MTAYHGSGRTATSIDVYERLRTHLVEQMGVDPAPETQDLHLLMLRNQPLPDLDAPAAVTGKSFDPSFVGRAEELEWLVSRWEGAARATPLFTLIVGEAGIGKTRLASEVAEVVRTTGGRVVQARCYETVSVRQVRVPRNSRPLLTERVFTSTYGTSTCPTRVGPNGI